MKAERVPALTVQIGDRINLAGSIDFTVEWTGHDDDSGSVMLAGTTNSGRPHTSHLSEHAQVTKLT